MKLTCQVIKDKRIIRAGLAYVAEVHLNSGHVIDAGRHLTLIAAQRSLARYPSDVFEGNDNPAKTRESDKKRKKRTGLASRRPHRRKNDGEYTRLFDRRIL